MTDFLKKINPFLFLKWNENYNNIIIMCFVSNGLLLLWLVLFSSFVFWSFPIISFRILLISLLMTYSGNIYYYFLDKK